VHETLRLRCLRNNWKVRNQNVRLTVSALLRKCALLRKWKCTQLDIIHSILTRVQIYRVQNRSSFTKTKIFPCLSVLLRQKNVIMQQLTCVCVCAPVLSGRDGSSERGPAVSSDSSEQSSSAETNRHTPLTHTGEGTTRIRRTGAPGPTVSLYL
jgi:hypothetical protein